MSLFYLININTLKKHLSLFATSASILILFLLFSSCKKDPDQIGLDVQPNSDRLNVAYSDTSSLLVYSVLDDSVITSKYSIMLLGSIYDPIFGKTTASIYSKVWLSNNSVTFGTNPVADSLVLILPYKGYYGDTITQQKLYVYELNEGLSNDSNYYSNRSLNYINTNIAQNPGGFDFYPRPNSYVTIGSTTNNPKLRISLDLVYAQQKFIAKSGQVELSDNANFTSYLKGLLIKAAPINAVNTGSLNYFDFSSGASKLVLYYHNDTDTTSFEFRMNSDSACFINYTHDYSLASSDFKNQVINKDTTLGNQTLYLQADGGVKTLIKFPNLKNYISSGRIIINEAELVMTNAESSSGNFLPPDRITLRYKGSDGYDHFIPDNTNLLGDDVTFGGYYDPTKKEYRFRIKNYLQQLIDGGLEDNGIFVKVYGWAFKGNRVVLNGAGNTIPNRFRLRLIYTKI
jgi:hypothetical protein